MKYLYVAPRFHPNQYPIMEGLIRKGNQVFFCVTKIGETEKHGDVEVKVLNPGVITKFMKRIWSKKGETYLENRLVFWFVPSLKEVRETIQTIKPDIVILRDRNLLSLITLWTCRIQGIKKVLLYNQSPIYIIPDKTSKRIIRKIWFSLFPKKRISVCRYFSFPELSVTYQKDENAYFMPHVPRINKMFERSYLQCGIVNILDCGKYRDYKNHMLLLAAVKNLVDQGYNNFHLTILGQAVNAQEIDYYEMCRRYIEENEIKTYVSLMNCVPYDEVPRYYLANDLFVLPSRSEQATVSILDSMSYGLATISTSRNGTADYLTPGVTGSIFKTNDVEDLTAKIKEYLQHPEIIETQGLNAMRESCENFGFENYYQKMKKIIEELG